MAQVPIEDHHHHHEETSFSSSLDLEAERVANEKKLELYDDMLATSESVAAVDPNLAASLSRRVKEDKIKAIDNQIEILNKLYNQKCKKNKPQSSNNSVWGEQIKSIGDQMKAMQEMYDRRFREEVTTVQTEEDLVSVLTEDQDPSAFGLEEEVEDLKTNKGFTSRLFGRKKNQHGFLLKCQAPCCRSRGPRLWKKAFIAEMDEEIDSMKDYLQELKIKENKASSDKTTSLDVDTSTTSTSTTKKYHRRRSGSPSWRALSMSGTATGNRKASPARKKARNLSPSR